MREQREQSQTNQRKESKADVQISKATVTDTSFDASFFLAYIGTEKKQPNSRRS